ncbi:MAG: 50S ribosomal protein L18 [Phycisphaerales bacterium]|jgi:large subunit ribosomal protein L18|nr:50S ribosomal protein L18 [Phycisphaerales bacterium]MBT7171592.1 50S ribosomal protein L18 [Phycisphaerales bacterium]
MKRVEKKIEQRIRRKKHVRKKVAGTPVRPRLTVFRSNKNIYAQLIDDVAGKTICTASTQDEAISIEGSAGNAAAAATVGTALAGKALEQGIKQVVFDRNGYAYHGRVRELAEAARKGGLEF